MKPMSFFKNTPIVFAAVIGLTACASRQSTITKTETTTDAIATDAIKAVCPMNYAPVCATVVQDGQTIQKTFSNECMASISAHKVISTANGACSKPY